MSIYIRIFGAVFIMLSALFIGREYSRFSDKRIGELRGFLLFVRHVGGRVSNYLSFGNELFWGFECGELESVGFLSHLREGKSLYESFMLCCPRLSIPLAQKEALKEFFHTFGNDYREGELEKITAFLEKYEKEAERECENMTKSLRVTRALLLGGALWVGIMVM